MGLFKRLICAAICATMMVSFCGTVSAATDAIAIDSILISEYTNELDAVDDTVVKVKVSFTSLETEEITILVATEELTEMDDSKILYIDQVAKPAEGYYEFIIEKARIKSATGLQDIEDVTLYVMVGGKNVNNMARESFTYKDPSVKVIKGDANGDGTVDNKDGTTLKQYLADWTLTNVVEAAMNVNGDDTIDNKDGTILLQYLANWNVELK